MPKKTTRFVSKPCSDFALQNWKKLRDFSIETRFAALSAPATFETEWRCRKSVSKRFRSRFSEVFSCQTVAKLPKGVSKPSPNSGIREIARKLPAKKSRSDDDATVMCQFDRIKFLCPILSQIPSMPLSHVPSILPRFGNGSARRLLYKGAPTTVCANWQPRPGSGREARQRPPHQNTQTKTLNSHISLE
jgi:hypothetical protein